MGYKKKIVTIICYYGKFPWYFNYFLHSCKYNPTIKFIIITDNNYKGCLYENVTIVKRSLEEIRKLASKKLGFEVKIDFPYKLCDFKPAYGFIFSEFIEGYEFWGYGDIDVIFGNIRNFVSEDILKKYDVISVRHDYLPGCFALFKNLKNINELFKQSKDYKKVFTNAKYFNFDEATFSFYEFHHSWAIENIPNNVESMTYFLKKYAKQKSIKAYFDLHVIEGTPGKIKWDNGILTYDDKYEILLYHLLEFKKKYVQKGVYKIPNIFYISPNKIYFKNDNLDNR